jgi:hypothetical protein
MSVHRVVPVRGLLLACLTVAAACGSSSVLGPDAEQGIEGIALRGPMCPVQTLENPCPDRPYQAWVTLVDGGGGYVTRFRTGQDGRFRVGLHSGDYTLVPDAGEPFPTSSPVDAPVVAGAYTDVVLSFDTGIR